MCVMLMSRAADTSLGECLGRGGEDYLTGAAGGQHGYRSYKTSQACSALVQRIDSQADLGALNLQHQRACINERWRCKQGRSGSQSLPFMRHSVTSQTAGWWWSKHLLAGGRQEEHL